MKEIQQNPFRILGLPITASAREIERQINTLETYAEMGKAISLETDFSFWPSVERSPEVIADAKKKIQIDEQKFLHSLFWFWRNNSVDELALELLGEGKVDKAIEIWEKAVFTRHEKVYRSVPFISDLIRESDGWSNQDDDDHSLGRQGGEYTIERKVETSSSIPVVYAEFGDETESWSIECEVEWMGGVDNNGFGIIFGRENDSYFSFEISGNGYFRFGKTVKWNYVELLPWKQFSVIEELEPNRLQIKKIKDTFSFYINGALAGFTISEPLFGSKFGFKVSGKQTIVFRKFQFSILKQDDRYGRGVVVTNRNLSCVKNLSILFLSQAVEHGVLKSHVFDKAAILANKFFTFDQVEAHSKLIAGDRFSYDSKRTLTFYLTTLVNSLKTTLDKTYGVTSKSFITAFTEFPNGAGNLVKNKFVGQTIQTINKFVEKAQNERRAVPSSAVEIGKELIGNVAANIDYLRETLVDNDFEFQVTADKVANEVVQCGIDYFNTTKNDEPCLPLYEFGIATAVSVGAKERAKENFDSCEHWIKISTPKSNIYTTLERTRRERDLAPLKAIDCGKSLAESTKADLAKLRKTLGDNNPEYKEIADLLAREAIQCAIHFFNTSKNDEEGLALYQFGFAIAGTAQAKKWAKENLDTCNEWIKTKVYRVCFFCGENEPDKASSVSKTMYLVTNRSYQAAELFSNAKRGVEFSYGDVDVPRCRDCACVHAQQKKYSTIITGIVIGSLVIGFLAGGLIISEQLMLVGGLSGATVAGFAAWILAKRFITPIDTNGIKNVNMTTQYPTIQERLKKGWTLSKPSA